MARKKYTRRKTKKKKEVVELVTKCDQCGKSLGRTCARTDQSGICAGAEGIFTIGRHSDIKFFCSLDCYYYFIDNNHGELLLKFY